jgi:chemotaxis signal transduction protein
VNVFAENALALARVGEDLIGLDLSRVLALLETPRVTPLPRLPACCEGIAFWHGSILPVYDLKKALNLPTSGDDTTSRGRISSAPASKDRFSASEDPGRETSGEAIVLVARWRDAPVGLRVDEALRVIEAPPLEPCPSAAPQMRGEATFEGRRLYVLEPRAAYPGTQVESLRASSERSSASEDPGAGPQD